MNLKKIWSLSSILCIHLFINSMEDQENNYQSEPKRKKVKIRHRIEINQGKLKNIKQEPEAMTLNLTELPSEILIIIFQKGQSILCGDNIYTFWKNTQGYLPNLKLVNKKFNFHATYLISNKANELKLKEQAKYCFGHEYLKLSQKELNIQLINGLNNLAQASSDFAGKNYSNRFNRNIDLKQLVNTSFSIDILKNEIKNTFEENLKDLLENKSKYFDKLKIAEVQVLKLIISGADVNHKFYDESDEDEYPTPFRKSCFIGNIFVVKLSIAYGAKIDDYIQRYSNISPLHIALNTRNIQIAKVLVNAGANIYIPENSTERGWEISPKTPLAKAILLGQVNLVKLMIARNNIPDELKIFCFMMAVKNDSKNQILQQFILGQNV